MPIVNLQRRLHEIGRIRLGEKVEGRRQDGSTYTRPDKLEAFRFTSSDVKAINDMSDLYGGTPQPWPGAPGGTEQHELYSEASAIDVMIPPEAMSFSQFFELWSKGGCQRRCDGERMSDDRECLCDPENRECRPHTRLSLMLTDFPQSGLWRLDTQGMNAAIELGGAFELASLVLRATGKALLNGRLRVEQRSSIDSEGKTHYFVVPILDILDMAALATQQALSPVQAVPALESGTSLLGALQEVENRAPAAPRANAAATIPRANVAPRTADQAATPTEPPPWAELGYSNGDEFEHIHELLTGSWPKLNEAQTTEARELLKSLGMTVRWPLPVKVAGALTRAMADMLAPQSYDPPVNQESLDGEPETAEDDPRAEGTSETSKRAPSLKDVERAGATEDEVTAAIAVAQSMPAGAVGDALIVRGLSTIGKLDTLKQRLALSMALEAAEQRKVSDAFDGAKFDEEATDEHD